MTKPGYCPHDIGSSESCWKCRRISYEEASRERAYFNGTDFSLIELGREWGLTTRGMDILYNSRCSACDFAALKPRHLSALKGYGRKTSVDVNRFQMFLRRRLPLIAEHRRKLSELKELCAEAKGVGYVIKESVIDRAGQCENSHVS